jgi:SAM-dependent methyltransferase
MTAVDGMKGYDAATYGDRIADDYELLTTPTQVVAPSVDAARAARKLAELADGQPALELGIGTGRIALPLAELGVEVHGIDASTAMVERLRDRPGADAVEVTMGDFADVPVDGDFGLVFVVYNTFFALTTEEEQRRCFRRVAERLRPGGLFAVEAFVPDLDRFVGGQALRVREISVDEVVLDASLHDAAQQRVDAQLIRLREDGVRLYPISLRYAWPGQLDEMATAAGLRLRDRWVDWDETPFDETSGSHVSIWERPP